MIEKMNIFDVEIPILTAKEAMIRAMQYLESESVDTIELVSMDMLMKERENAQWKEQINALTMLLPENTEILKAAEIENEKLFRETEENVFLKMFMKYMQKMPSTERRRTVSCRCCRPRFRNGLLRQIKPF